MAVEQVAISPSTGTHPLRDQLACVITMGEAGSTADHYQQGMHTAFTVW